MQFLVKAAFLGGALSFGHAAAADSFTDAIIADLRGQGFGFIELKDGPGQVKVEAVRGGQKVEAIYDRATGRILKREIERAEARDLGRSGVLVRFSDRDFLDGGRFRDDDDGDRSGRRGGDDDRSGQRGGGDDRSGRHDDDDDRSGHHVDDDDRSGQHGGDDDRSGHGGGGHDD